MRHANIYKTMTKRWSQHRSRVVITDPSLVFFVTSQRAKFQSCGFFAQAFAARAEAVKGNFVPFGTFKMQI